MKRIICLDVGERRIGIAVSDLLGLTAQPVKTLESKGFLNDLNEYKALSKYYDTNCILLGLPINMNGTEGPKAQMMREYAQKLTDEGFIVRFEDERMTTMLAHNTLLEADISRKKRKGTVDKLAAVFILQSFLDSGKKF